MRRIQSLDGLRAISIILVLMLHTLQTINSVVPVSWVWFVLGNGNLGVYIFFVISGYLITLLLLREYEKRGSIRLEDFYLRRAFRILPPAYFNIAVVALLAAVGKIQLTRSSVLSSLFFFRNYTYDRVWPLGHFWSLSVEEQFYIFWPLALIVCLRYSPRKVATKLAAAVILICPLIRMASFVFLRHVNARAFQNRADAVMFGCITALLAGAPFFEKIYSYVARRWWIAPVVLIFVSGGLGARYGNRWDYSLGITVDGVCIAITLLWCVRNPDSSPGRFLNSRLLKHIGVLSYSIYIWQQLFLNPESRGTFGTHSLWFDLPLSYALVLAAAELSYHVIEKPSIELRKHLESRMHVTRAEVCADGPSNAT